MRAVAVFRSSYLPISETFISDHLRTLRRFRPVVICELDLPADHRIAAAPLVAWRGRLGRFLFRRFGFAPWLLRRLRQEKVALIHAHFLIDAAVLLPFARRSGLPLIVTAHGYDATLNDSELMKFPEGRMLLQRSKHLAAFAKRFVCVSDFLRSELLARGYPDDKLLTLPLGVNLEELTARPADQLGQGIIAVGRLVEKKGMRYLIEAYAALPAPLRAAHPLTIIGDGPLREALVDLARDLALSIEFTGSQPRHDVLRRVRRARVFCLPSVRAATGDAEGMGIVIMEALAQGVPAVIFAGQPMAPLLAREKAGLVAIDADAQDLAAQIGGILQDDAMARHFSRRGRAFCERHFSLRRNVDLLEELYSEVTGR